MRSSSTPRKIASRPAPRSQPSRAHVHPRSARVLRRLRRAREELLEQSRINETLHRIGAALAAELDLDRLVQRLTDEATALTRAQKHLSIVHASGAALARAVRWGQAEFIEDRIRRGRRIRRGLIERKQA